ncbi:hypothetical protein [Streptomyces sp. NPDC004376]
MDTQDSAGEVRLTITGQILIEGGESPERPEPRPITCPKCAQSSNLVLVARGATAKLHCTNDHAWTDALVSAAAIRQLQHLSSTGQPIVWPGSQVCIPLLEVLDDNDEAARGVPFPDLADGESISDTEDWWDTYVAAASGARHSLFGECWRQAWGIVNTAVPVDGSLYQQLYVTAGGRAVDAHMTILLLALAIYEAARTSRIGKLMLLPLPAPASYLNSDYLRTARPVPDYDDGTLPIRATDDQRLRTAPALDWERWCTASRDALTFVIKQDLANRGLPDDDKWQLNLGDRALVFGGKSSDYTVRDAHGRDRN